MWSSDRSLDDRENRHNLVEEGAAVKERLIDRVPTGALRSFHQRVGDLDHRRALKKLSPEGTKRYYRIKLANYERWCASMDYQTDIMFITDARVEEYVGHLVSPDVLAAPSTINQTLSALAHYAERAAVDPMPSFRAGRHVLKTYKSELERLKLIG